MTEENGEGKKDRRRCHQKERINCIPEPKLRNIPITTKDKDEQVGGGWIWGRMETVLEWGKKEEPEAEVEGNIGDDAHFYAIAESR